MYDITRIRNFSIIAHIDHGKSTLSDRLLELTGTVPPAKMRDQVLDSMELERERGITIKSHVIRMYYKFPGDGREYILNLIDTPGHVDFTYEVSRALVACEGAFLLVDASQGIEAQTISNFYLAQQSNLTILPLVNKIDLPSAQVEETQSALAELVGVDKKDVLLVSAKEGIGIEAVLSSAIERIPPPTGNPDAPLTALIFDAYYDNYRGVVVYVRLFDGRIEVGDRIRLFSRGREYDVEEAGYFRMGLVSTGSLMAGEVGYIIAGIKDVREARIGETIISVKNPVSVPLSAYREVKPMVFSGFYPADGSQFEELKEALDKFRLNDAALTYEPESSLALGYGFRCGFLGLLHMEIVQERLSREFGIELVATVPSVKYRVVMKDGEVMLIDNPARLPPPIKIERIEEPYANCEVITPTTYIGAVMKLINERRGELASTEFTESGKVIIRFELPLAELIYDFYDKLKSISRGYASFDYEFAGFRKSDLVRLDILVNGEAVDALSVIVYRDFAYRVGSELTRKLKELIPRQLFEVVIQAAIGSRVIARTRIPPIRKKVTAKCYGGDITRKRKLLERQKAGKRRMKQIGNVILPQEAFFALLKVER